MTKPKIFISGSAADREWVRAFVKSLFELGAQVWVDEGEGDGEGKEALEKGLRSSQVFTCVITPETARRPTLWFELGAAIGTGKRVVPILPRDLDTSELLPPLRLHKSLYKGSPEGTARELLAVTTERAVVNKEKKSAS